jgi:hypothetical protein
MPATVWAFVGMKKFIIKRRCWKHKKYVSTRMAELQMEICKEAIKTGIVNETKRKQLFKYKEHYEYFK